LKCRLDVVLNVQAARHDAKPPLELDTTHDP